MSYVIRVLSLLAFAGCCAVLQAQTTLLEENFNTCALPANWQANSTGFSTPAWYVGLAQNPAIQNQSIDGSCFLFIDDDANGSGSASYVLNFTSPAFDVTPFSTVECSMDVYFRFGQEDYIQILATDGATETLLARFDKFRTNGTDLAADHFKLRHDLALVSQTANTRIIIRYTSPNGSKGNFAGIDNIKITGSGTGKNVVREAFNQCQKPAGWQSDLVSGATGWQFGKVLLGSSAFYDGNSMDGSCFVFFDDNAQGANAAPSAMRLTSPWFNGMEYYKYELNFDLILRYNGEVITVYAEKESGEKFVLISSNDTSVGGPFFPNYKHFTVDLSPYRSTQLRIIFDYSDGNAHGYWVGIDNVKVTGMEPGSDFCSNARNLFTGAPCASVDNLTALFDGPATACAGRTSGSIWYKWQADFTGLAKLVTNASFNDVVSIFTGSCASPQLALCNNRDEHGFTGESTYFPAQAGTTYLIRITGQEDGFGLARGLVCPQLSQAPDYPTRPANDDCANALVLAANAACTAGTNANGTMSATLPTLNELARADVWYRFTAAALPANQHYVLQSNADFSDIITLYAGACGALQELAGNHKGGSLTLPALTPGQTYWVQIAGNFATVEGHVCPQLLTETSGLSVNDNCPAALDVSLDGTAVMTDNLNAGASGLHPACALTTDRDVWFRFVAPASGAVRINTGADFEHTLAVWQGPCTALTPFFCKLNPLKCEGYVTVAGLHAGDTYFVQIASVDGPAGLNSGHIGLKMLDSQLPLDTKPLEMLAFQPCIGMDSAWLKISVSGGVPPYQYSGNTPGQILASGTSFLAVVTDARGCEVYTDGIVKDCASNECTISIALTPTAVSCYGESDGALSAGATGGTGPFTFNWSDGTPTAYNDGLSAGVYGLTVTDANGCESIVSATLSQPDSILVSTTLVVSPAQGQQNGALEVQVSGGHGNYAYTWLRNDSLFASGSARLDSIPNGYYVVLVSDSAGCTGSFGYLLETVSTHQPQEAFSATLSPNPASGKAWLSVSLPKPQALHLSLSDGAGRVLRQWRVNELLESRIPIDLSGLPAGGYTLFVRTEKYGIAKRVLVKE
ncbi:MAG: SprB repeat-containing protein [Saprospiraceae bacterium]|nr:SprB repeat-containing protein [Saprospiraceae bacterium]